MAIAPSPGLLRVHDLTTEGLELAWNVGAGVVTGTWSPGAGAWVCSGSGLADDLVLSLDAFMKANIAGAASATLDASALLPRLVLDPGAGNTIAVNGAAAASTLDARWLGFSKVNTPQAATQTAPAAPLGVWFSPVPLGRDFGRQTELAAFQTTSVNGQVVSGIRGFSISKRLSFTFVPEANVFSSGQRLTNTIHDSDGFERFIQYNADGQRFQYVDDKTTGASPTLFVLDNQNVGPFAQAHEGLPFWGFELTALGYEA